MRKYSSSSQQTTTFQKRTIHQFQSKPRQLLNHRKQLNDGIDFKPSLSIGLTSNIFQLSQEQQICYISGNQYCIASSIDAQNMTVEYLPCNSIQGEVKAIQIIKNKKLSMVASLQVLQTSVNQINKINYFSRRDQAHRDITITAKGNILGFVILSEGKIGFALLNQSTEMVNKFLIYFINVERESVIIKLDKPHKPIKIISSTMSDYNMILCETVIYEIEIGVNQDIQLVEFQVRQFLDQGEYYIEGGFVKSSFNLVLITNKYKVLLFDHHKLLSKHQLSAISKLSPTITDLQAGISEIVIELDKKRLCVYNLKSRQFQFGGFVNLLETMQGDYKILNFKIMRRQIYIMIEQKTVEIWRVSLRSKGQENLQLLSNNISLLDYKNPPTLEIVVSPIAIKQMLTVHSDSILRVWDLDKGLKGMKPLFEHVYCLTIHPIGNQLFVGFKEYGRIFALAGFELQMKHSFKIKGLLACKYTLDGQYLLLQQSNTIYQYNAYSYETIRSVFINLNNVTKIDLIDNIFYLQNDNYLGLYTLDGGKIIEKRTNCYCSNNECLVFIEGNFINVFTKSGEEIQKQEKIKLSLQENQKVTVIKLVDLLGIILIGTSKGYIYEFLYPVPVDKRDSSYKYKAMDSAIVDIIVHQTHESLTVITQNSIITTFEFIQLLEGQKTTTIYTISKVDKITGTNSRKSIMNREYIFKGYEIESSVLEAEKAKEIMELEFYTQNFINESEEKKVKIRQRLEEELNRNKRIGEGDCEEINNQISGLRNDWGGRITNVKNEIQSKRNKFQKEKQELINTYEQKLLSIIYKDKQLKQLKQNEKIRLKQIIDRLVEKQHELGISLFQQRQSQYAVLYNKLINISKQLKTDRQKAVMIEDEVEGQYKQLINSITKQLNDELQIEQNKNRGLNVNISKLKQQISIFNLRNKQLQNVIDEMQKQIKQLQQIKQQYEMKKQEMETELNDKEMIINSKEQELKKIFTENKNKKNLKDIHEYLMMEYQKELEPGEMKRNELLMKVKEMNKELNNETQWKVDIKKQMKEAQGKIEQLKALKQKAKYQNIDIENKLIALGHSIKKTMKKEPVEWMTQFRVLWDSLKSANANQSHTISTDKPIVTNKMIAKVIVGKEEIHRKIIESQKATIWQEKHKEGVYKKIQNENIELVKEHNLLQIEKKHLQEHIQLLKTSMLMIEQADGVPLKRKSASLGVLTNRPIVKQTPFQQYTADQDQSKKRFSSIEKPLSTTRLKPIANSSTWMKSVVDDIIKSKGQAGNIIQRKISSFANPEKSKMRKIISLHSHESSDKGEKMSKLFNNVVLQGGRERVMSGKERIDSARKP